MKLIIVTLFASLLLIPSTASARPDSFAPIVKLERKKVVHIGTTSVVNGMELDPFFKQFFPNAPKQRRQSALGSGFIISENGLIVTNNHVVAKAEKITVTLYDDRKFKATVIGRDPRTDLALIKIDAKGLPIVKFGNSSGLEIGDWVIAIGNPLGLDYSVTAGILSARGRDIFGGTAYGQFLQTDAAINPGNSGGPLFNIKGEVIGINTAIVAGGQGLGFAIPSNLALNVVKQLKQGGVVKRGWFGVGIQNVTTELAESFGLPKGQKGVAITSVGDASPAKKAGLKRGDILLEFEGKKLSKTTQLQQFVAETQPGDKVKIKIFRNGDIINLEVKVGTVPNTEFSTLDSSSNKFGFTLIEINDLLKRKLKLKEKSGLYVKEIDASGLAYGAGIRNGDIIIEANQKKLTSIKDFNDVVKTSKGKRMALLIKRNEQPLFIPLPLNK